MGTLDSKTKAPSAEKSAGATRIPHSSPGRRREKTGFFQLFLPPTTVLRTLSSEKSHLSKSGFDMDESALSELFGPDLLDIPPLGSLDTDVDMPGPAAPVACTAAAADVLSDMPDSVLEMVLNGPGTSDSSSASPCASGSSASSPRDASRGGNAAVGQFDIQEIEDILKELTQNQQQPSHQQQQPPQQTKKLEQQQQAQNQQLASAQKQKQPAQQQPAQQQQQQQQQPAEQQQQQQQPAQLHEKEQDKPHLHLSDDQAMPVQEKHKKHEIMQQPAHMGEGGEANGKENQHPQLDASDILGLRSFLGPEGQVGEAKLVQDANGGPAVVHISFPQPGEQPNHARTNSGVSEQSYHNHKQPIMKKSGEGRRVLGQLQPPTAMRTIGRRQTQVLGNQETKMAPTTSKNKPVGVSSSQTTRGQKISVLWNSFGKYFNRQQRYQNRQQQQQPPRQDLKQQPLPHYYHHQQQHQNGQQQQHLQQRQDLKQQQLPHYYHHQQQQPNHHQQQHQYQNGQQQQHVQQRQNRQRQQPQQQQINASHATINVYQSTHARYYGAPWQAHLWSHIPIPAHPAAQQTPPQAPVLQTSAPVLQEVPKTTQLYPPLQRNMPAETQTKQEWAPFDHTYAGAAFPNVLGVNVQNEKRYQAQQSMETQVREEQHQQQAVMQERQVQINQQQHYQQQPQQIELPQRPVPIVVLQQPQQQEQKQVPPPQQHQQQGEGEVPVRRRSRDRRHLPPAGGAPHPVLNFPEHHYANQPPQWRALQHGIDGRKCCPECGKPMADERSFQKHFRDIHRLIYCRVPNCTYAGIALVGYSRYNNHKVRHHGHHPREILKKGEGKNSSVKKKESRD